MGPDWALEIKPVRPKASTPAQPVGRITRRRRAPPRKGMDVRWGDLVGLGLQDLPDPNKGKLDNARILTTITTKSERVITDTSFLFSVLCVLFVCFAVILSDRLFFIAFWAQVGHWT